MIRVQTVFLAAACVALTACTHSPVKESAKHLSCEAGAVNMLRTELFFGLNRPDAPPIGEGEWQSFFQDVLVPGVGGATVLTGEGAWINDAGALSTEGSKLVIILHDATETMNTNIERVVKDYINRFDQESVLINSEQANFRFCAVG